MFRSLYQQKQHQSTYGHLSDKLLDLPASYSEGFVANPMPDWRLEVGGHVNQPRIFTEQQLRMLPQVTQNRRLVSADGWTYRTEWLGIPLNHLVETVKPNSQGTVIRQENLKGEVEYLTLQDALKSRVMLCIGVGNQPLPPVYGGPLRVLVFDRYSYKGLGQLSKIDFIAPEQVETSTGEARGYSKEGIIQPGKYYAFDLKRFRPVPQPGEVTIY